MKGIRDVTSATWDGEVLKAGMLVMVVFWAKWCEPCKKMFPAVEELAAEHAEKVKFVRLDIDNNDDIAGKYRVSIVPTVMFFKNDQKLHEAICLEPKPKLKAMIESLGG